MADNTLGGGYLYNAKPFNVINPTGIDPGQAVDVLKEVAEGARNRSFQAAEAEKDRALKAQQFSMDREDRAAERQSSEKLTRDQMAQQQGQFDEAQAAQEMQRSQELELERQKFEADQKREKRKMRLDMAIEKEARRTNQYNMDRIRLMEGINLVGSTGQVDVPGAATVSSMGGDAPKPTAGHMLDQFGSDLTEDEYQKYHLEMERVAGEDAKSQEKIKALLVLKELALGRGSKTETTPDGNSVLELTLKRMKQHQEARLQQITAIGPAIQNALVTAVTTTKHVDSESMLGAVGNAFEGAGRAIRASIPELYTGLSAAVRSSGLATDAAANYVQSKNLSGKTFEERYEQDKWVQAGMQPPPVFGERINTLADLVAEQLSPTKPGEAAPLMRTMMTNMVEAAGVLGNERDGKLKLAQEAYKALSEQVDPEVLDHAFYMMYQGVTGADKEADLMAKQANLDDPPVAGEDDEARKVRLNNAEKQRAGIAASKDAIRLRNGLRLLRDSLVPGVDPRTGEPTTEKAALVKHWGVLATPEAKGRTVGESLVKALGALAGSDDPLLLLDLLTDDDPSNDVGTPEAHQLFRDMHPDLKKFAREALLENRSSIKAMAQEHGLDLSALSPGHIKEQIQMLQQQSDRSRFETAAKVRSTVAARRAKKREQGDALYQKFLGESNEAWADLERSMEE